MKRDSRQVYTEYLVLQAQGGSDTAFRELFELWSVELVRLARVQLHKQEAVDDVGIPLEKRTRISQRIF